MRRNRYRRHFVLLEQNAHHTKGGGHGSWEGL